MGTPTRGVLMPHEYLEHVTAVNQLACTARQLRRDVCAGQFKYAAHKIALLYHAVNLSRGAARTCCASGSRSTSTRSRAPRRRATTRRRRLRLGARG